MNDAQTLPAERMTEIDRIAPTRRPEQAVAGYQEWRSLLFLHWPVDREALRHVVPQELELDEWRGEVWVGIVPFHMQNVAPSWWPRSLAFNFLECNLRTYVVHRGRPGVYFFSLDASSWLAVKAARIGWSLPYHHARMKEEMPAEGTRWSVVRGPRRVLDVTFKAKEPLGPSAPGSLEHFFLERYLLFAKRRGRIHSGTVHHAPYPAWRAEVLSCEEGLLEAAGLPAAEGVPHLAHWSPGVDVEVFGLRPSDATRLGTT